MTAAYRDLRSDGRIHSLCFALDALPSVGLTWYLEDMCRVELAALSTGLDDLPVVSAEQAQARATRQGRIFERMWDFLTHGDPEVYGLQG